jgi:hypothetical protein
LILHLSVAICEICLLYFTYGVCLVLSLKPGVTLSQPKVQMVTRTPPIATKSWCCDKKAWHKGQKFGLVWNLAHVHVNEILWGG